MTSKRNFLVMKKKGVFAMLALLYPISSCTTSLLSSYDYTTDTIWKTVYEITAEECVRIEVFRNMHMEEVEVFECHFWYNGNIITSLSNQLLFVERKFITSCDTPIACMQWTQKTIWA